MLVGEGRTRAWNALKLVGIREPFWPSSTMGSRYHKFSFIICCFSYGSDYNGWFHFQMFYVVFGATAPRRAGVFPCFCVLALCALLHMCVVDALPGWTGGWGGNSVSADCKIRLFKTCFQSTSRPPVESADDVRHSCWTECRKTACCTRCFGTAKGLQRDEERLSD